MTSAATASDTVRATATTSSGVNSRFHFPLRKAISRRLWKVWGTGLAGLLVGAGIVAGGYFDELRSQELGPGFHSLFNLSSARAIRYFSTILVMLAGQLALFIWWARSRAQGVSAVRYRSWGWLSVICFLASFVIGSEAHHAATETLVWFAGGQLSFHPELAWMIPGGTCVLGFLWLLHSDLRQNRTGLALLWLAALSWIAGGAIRRVGDLSLDPLYVTLIETGAVIFGYWCLLMSMLVHARHVVYGPIDGQTPGCAGDGRAAGQNKAAKSSDPAMPTRTTSQTRIDKPHSVSSRSSETAGQAERVQNGAVKGKAAMTVTRTDRRE